MSSSSPLQPTPWPWIRTEFAAAKVVGALLQLTIKDPRRGRGFAQSLRRPGLWVLAESMRCYFRPTPWPWIRTEFAAAKVVGPFYSRASEWLQIAINNAGFWTFGWIFLSRLRGKTYILAADALAVDSHGACGGQGCGSRQRIDADACIPRPGRGFAKSLRRPGLWVCVSTNSNSTS